MPENKQEQRLNYYSDFRFMNQFNVVNGYPSHNQHTRLDSRYHKYYLARFLKRTAEDLIEDGRVLQAIEVYEQAYRSLRPSVTNKNVLSLYNQLIETYSNNNTLDYIEYLRCERQLIGSCLEKDLESKFSKGYFIALTNLASSNETVLFALHNFILSVLNAEASRTELSRIIDNLLKTDPNNGIYNYLLVVISPNDYDTNTEIVKKLINTKYGAFLLANSRLQKTSIADKQIRETCLKLLLHISDYHQLASRAIAKYYQQEIDNFEESCQEMLTDSIQNLEVSDWKKHAELFYKKAIIQGDIFFGTDTALIAWRNILDYSSHSEEEENLPKLYQNIISRREEARNIWIELSQKFAEALNNAEYLSNGHEMLPFTIEENEKFMKAGPIYHELMKNSLILEEYLSSPNRKGSVPESETLRNIATRNEPVIMLDTSNKHELKIIPEENLAQLTL